MKNKIVLIGPYLVTIRIEFLAAAGRQFFLQLARPKQPGRRPDTFHKGYLVFIIFEGYLTIIIFYCVILILFRRYLENS